METYDRSYMDIRQIYSDAMKQAIIQVRVKLSNNQGKMKGKM